MWGYLAGIATDYCLVWGLLAIGLGYYGCIDCFKGVFRGYLGLGGRGMA